MIFTLFWFLLAIPLMVYGVFRLFFKNRNRDEKYKKTDHIHTSIWIIYVFNSFYSVFCNHIFQIISNRNLENEKKHTTHKT